MLISPQADEDPQVLADWWELSALSDPTDEVPLADLMGAFLLSDDGMKQPHELQEEAVATEAIDDENVNVEQAAETIAAEIQCRLNALDESYPFVLSRDGEVLSLKGELSLDQITYLFCLALSHAGSSPVTEIGLMPDKGNFEANLFQACATVAAAGYSDGNAYSFGYPRTDATNFLDKLRAIFGHIKDGRVAAHPRPSASRDQKDDQVDTISWRDSPDGLPIGTLLFGQAASGANWRSKPLSGHLKKFFATWFDHPPARPVEAAIIIPHCVHAPRRNWGEGFSREDILRDNFQLLMAEFGQILHRTRVPKYVAIGLSIGQREEFVVEGVDQLPQLVDWLYGFKGSLRDNV